MMRCANSSESEHPNCIADNGLQFDGVFRTEMELLLSWSEGRKDFSFSKRRGQRWRRRRRGIDLAWGACPTPTVSAAAGSSDDRGPYVNNTMYFLMISIRFREKSCGLRFVIKKKVKTPCAYGAVMADFWFYFSDLVAKNLPWQLYRGEP